MSQKYAFLDRDGALIYEPSLEETPSGEVPYQIDSIEKLKILPGVLTGLKKLREEGFKLVLISNQDDLGKKIFPRPNFERPQQKMLKVFRENGIEFEEIFICPHTLEDECLCRKPKTGLVEEFFERNEVDRENSFMYGDRESDEQFAKNLNIKFIKAKTNEKFNLDN
jgi:imidazoleglycerol-phosphate dehydratase / histidinol-phosphatase